MQVDPTGKVSLDHIYTQPDPRAYFTTLRPLDYRIPESAKPHFARVITEYRASRGVRAPRVLDIGCSYGINATLLKCDATMDDLYERYGGDEAAGLDRTGLLTRDRRFLEENRHRGVVPDGIEFVGLDASRPALDYGLAAGFLDAVVHADLESAEPTEAQRERLTGIDLVISTGCLGYVTEKTIARVLDAQDGHRPWMAHFVLRMFPFTPIADTLAAAGYRTVRVDGLFPQRRFATAEEQSLVLDGLRANAVDPAGLEAEGRLYAELFVSRPLT